ncbi:hypothetical protein G7Y89_g14851 [Cudoniella acicularis]|uniref:galacturonan 1,4-alpha-galacturonidase n=1 Tax=Cudoniella acicularis TaxID=354080 RepID=A0A8H4QXH7_9HELO|nr:hypothetical protein G7Y89_g14851 [Cudoniella acicularis]
MKSILIALLPTFAALTTAIPWTPKTPSKTSSWGPDPRSPSKNGKTCTVQALGGKKDDTPQILKAFADCNHGGTVVFPEDQNYWIATKLNPVIYDVTVDWKGTWTFSDDLTYWRNNSYPIFFQNHHAGFVISGERIHVNGYGTGGINGNGNAWYNVEQAVTQPGRPMPFVFNNTAEVFVEHCQGFPSLVLEYYEWHQYVVRQYLL